jgi:hypothetical protein
MARIFGSQLAELVAAARRDHGVDWHVGRKVDEVTEGAVRLDDGTPLDADLVVVGIAPRIGLARLPASPRRRRVGGRASRHQRAGHLRRRRHRALARSLQRRTHSRFIIQRFLKLKEWKDTSRIAIGGRFRAAGSAR